MKVQEIFESLNVQPKWSQVRNVAEFFFDKSESEEILVGAEVEEEFLGEGVLD